MIRINLLPEEYRRAERTSPKIFAALVGAVVLVCCSLGWFGFVYFGELDRLQREHSELEERLTNLNRQVKYFDALTAEKVDFEQREKTIKDISKSRVLWTRVLDQLIDTVNNDGNVDRHMAWFRSINVAEGRGKQGPSVAMPGWVQGDEFKRLGDFHDDLERTPFFVNVVEKDAPDGKVEIDDDKTPPEALFTELKWKFRPPSEWVTPAPETPENAPAPK